SRLALVHAPPRAGQYHHHSAAAEVPRAQPGRERLAVHARQLALQPHLQILRRSRRPLLCGMEQARRSALAHHVHRTAPMGPRVLINGFWYKCTGLRRCPTADFRNYPIGSAMQDQDGGHSRLIHAFTNCLASACDTPDMRNLRNLFFATPRHENVSRIADDGECCANQSCPAASILNREVLLEFVTDPPPQTHDVSPRLLEL